MTTRRSNHVPSLRLELGTAEVLGEHIFTTVDLFLFSAAGWHPHRIHFDHQYATEVEGHPGLVVHGPLQAVRLFQALDEAIPENAIITGTKYRHVAPLYVDNPVTFHAEVTSVDASSAVVSVFVETADAVRTTTGSAAITLA